MKNLTDNLFLIGGMGAGKTTIGRKLAEQLHYDFYDLDLEIESKTGVDIAWIFEIEGEIGFRKREQTLLQTLVANRRTVIATGGGTILDVTNRQLLSEKGTVIYLKTTIEHQITRLSRDKKRPLLQVEDREAVLTDLMSRREILYENTADYIIETGHQSVTKIVSSIMKMVFG